MSKKVTIKIYSSIAGVGILCINSSSTCSIKSLRIIKRIYN